MPEGSSSPEDLYLDLLAKCLTRYLFPDEGTPFVPGTPGKRRVWSRAERLLERRGLRVLRRAPLRPELREDGRDWPLTAETMVGLARLENSRACIETALRDGVPGDVAEAGVWRGGSAIFMRAVLAAHGDGSRTVWVADSFEGLPPPDPAHAADAGDLHHTEPFLAVSQQEVMDNFARYGLLDERVRFLPGWFADTLPTAPIDTLAVLRVDGDMYGSTMDVLDALHPRVAPGGFVIVDDYGAITACRTAVDEYRQRHGIADPLQRIDWTGVYWRRAA